MQSNVPAAALAYVPPRGPSLQKRLAPLDGLAPDALRIHEIYASLQGEGTHVGLPCTLVRLTACHLRCTYCDTAHAFGRGEQMTLDEVVGRTLALHPKLVLITGGEPLLQPAALPLMRRLCDAGRTVLLETSGALPIDDVDPRVRRIVDFKAPSSGECAANCWENVAQLRPHDEVKFVLGDRADYAWACGVVAEHRLTERCSVLFGPVFGRLQPKDLAAWMLQDALDVRMQVQLHKFIWDPAARGV